MKVAVSGIGGFLGRHLATFLGSRFEVFGISSSGVKVDFPVVDFNRLDQIAPDVIVHCHAAVSSGTTVLDKETLYDGNIVATERILDQFPNAKHLYISTASVYGPACETITEHTQPNPQTDYAQSKRDAENLVLQQRQSAVIRLSSLYGIGMKPNTLIPNYVTQALEKQTITVWGTGARKQNYFHIDDAVSLIQTIIEKGQWHQPIFLGVSNWEFTNLEIAQIVASATNAQIVHQNDDTSISVKYDNSFTQNTLNWHPETNIESGIKSYIEWRKKQY
ncbi:NAD-dependent epimerase/dehydratase family protein [Flavobacterium caeni]|uniref:Nucleoside-diphosphate-sugar epimerase n=1 Tax=Flavobacterium caeni TaxID=490189 RepID=A0A1G5FH55_9FLAO|nr:NAD(P)-dependent oxidoreductase [Flavobacterium caeni]SCY38434.1 Nucleoside-diphosphate-sugar epimerase [Flavobacterium caeni]